MSTKMLLSFALTYFHALVFAYSDPTPAPALPDLRARQATQSTNYFSIYETAIPDDKYFMGRGRGIFPDGGTTDYWIACTQNPYTVSGGFAGCGSDDLYTQCAGNVAKAKDGTDITCRTSLGFACMTAAIYKDLDATSYDSWIKCGSSGEKTSLVRTPTGRSTTLSGAEAQATGSGATRSPTSGGASASSAAASATTTSDGNAIKIGLPLLLTFWSSILAVFLII